MKIPVIHPIHLTKIFVDIPEGYCLKLVDEITNIDLIYNFRKCEFEPAAIWMNNSRFKPFIIVTPDPKN